MEGEVEVEGEALPVPPMYDRECPAKYNQGAASPGLRSIPVVSSTSQADYDQTRGELPIYLDLSPRTISSIVPSNESKAQKHQSMSQTIRERRMPSPRSPLFTIAEHAENEHPHRTASPTPKSANRQCPRCEQSKRHTVHSMESEQLGRHLTSAKPEQEETLLLGHGKQQHDDPRRAPVSVGAEQHAEIVQELTRLHKLFMAQQRNALQQSLAVSSAQLEALEAQLAAANKAHAVLEEVVLSVEKDIAELD